MLSVKVIKVRKTFSTYFQNQRHKIHTTNQLITYCHSFLTSLKDLYAFQTCWWLILLHRFISFDRLIFVWSQFIILRNITQNIQFFFHTKLNWFQLPILMFFFYILGIWRQIKLVKKNISSQIHNFRQKKTFSISLNNN